jgi:Zn-dependent protease with chaperone function
MYINGLLGWVNANDRRSIKLFVGFLAVFHFTAIITLFIPTTLFDYAHAPIFNSTGYVSRYMPLVTLIAFLLFGILLWWQRNSVKKHFKFQYTYKKEEPRLCSIAEPLVISAGLAEPRIAVIESAAMNAFVFGLSQKNAVLVVTRGLLKNLDDDELANVIAHELMHIKNGDMRFMAAANACIMGINAIDSLNEQIGKKFTPLRQTLSWIFLVMMLPTLLLPMLTIIFARKCAVALGHFVRLLITASREFVADAEAIRLTQNPAAMISALQRIEGNSAIGDIPIEYDAMMIDGQTVGAHATHPTIAERIAAIVSVTGAVALVAARRKDTRAGSLRTPLIFGKKMPDISSYTLQVNQRDRFNWQALRRLIFQGENNLLSFSGPNIVGVSIGFFLFLVLHWDFLSPSVIADNFGFGSFGKIAKTSDDLRQCSERPGWSMEACQIDIFKKEHANDKTALEAIDFAVQQSRHKTFSSGSNLAANLDKNNISQQCFSTDFYAIGDRGLFDVNERSGDVSIDRYLGSMAKAAQDINAASNIDMLAKAKNYVDTQRNILPVIHQFYGQPGLERAKIEYGTTAHILAIQQLQRLLKDPATLVGLTPKDLHDWMLLAEAPDKFVPCSNGYAKLPL